LRHLVNVGSKLIHLLPFNSGGLLLRLRFNRSAVSEIENPFNLLRVISSEKDLKKLNSKRLPPGVKSLTLGKPEEKAPEEETEEKPEEKPSPFEEEKQLEQPPAGTKREVPPPQQRPKAFPKAGQGYLDWIWSLLDSGLSSDDILQLARSYEFMGYLPANSSEYIHSLAKACEKVRLKGFSKSRMLLDMYKAAAISGIKIGLEDVKGLISIAEGRLKSNRVEKTE